MKNLNTVKTELRNEYKDDYNMDVDVYFHNSYNRELEDKKFNYRCDTKGTGLVGMFAHMGNDDYFDVYGDSVYAVVVDRTGKRVNVRPVDDTNHSDNYEAFLPFESVEELRKVN